MHSDDYAFSLVFSDVCLDFFFILHFNYNRLFLGNLLKAVTFFEISSFISSISRI
jgi:hypothetical protein